MRFISTRGESIANSSYEALLKGLADDGGLFVPEDLKLAEIDDELFYNGSYADFAKSIISLIFDDIDQKKLSDAIDAAYATFEDPILPIKKLGNSYVMELYHGQTFAFKDFALSLLPRLIEISLDELGISEDIIILTATSGDTGSAALYGFKDVNRTKIVAFYPTEGISEIQRRQMSTIDGKNTFAIAINGNFDAAQSELKNIFNDRELEAELKKKGYLLSSANSINIGRLVPQIVYYFYSYAQIVRSGDIKRGDLVSISVPTGNFGNILAAYLAKKMGLPVKNLICGSNKNDVLTEFINTGFYNANREFFITNSPSMDILVSSNLERFLYYQLGDSNLIRDLMDSLKGKGEYKIDKKLDGILAYSYDDEKTLDEIKCVYDEFGYLVDTHTAIATRAAREYSKDNEEAVLVASTASPFKFSNSIIKAFGLEASDELSSIDVLSKNLNIEVPSTFVDLLSRDITQKRVVNREDMREIVKEIAN